VSTYIPSADQWNPTKAEVDRLIAERRRQEAERRADFAVDGPPSPQALLADHEIRRGYYDRAYSTYLRVGIEGLAERDREILNGEYRDLSVGTNSAGGYTVPPGLLRRLTVALKRSSAMYRAATVVTTTTGEPTSWPTSDDTSNVGAILAENTAATAQDVTFGSKTLSAFMYTSKPVRVSFQLVQDSAFDLDGFLARVLGARIARAANPHFTTGTGGGTQPVGLIPNATVGVTLPTGNTTTLTYDGLVDLIGSVNEEYLVGADELGGEPAEGFTGFMLSSAALKAARKVKDTANAPVVTEGSPVRILGWPVIVNPDMAVPAANAKSVAFGNFGAAYVVRRCTQEAVLLKLEERYADALQIGYQSYYRLDGNTDDLAAVRVLVHSAT
jgi:HK97 family phage major capsid protein